MDPNTAQYLCKIVGVIFGILALLCGFGVFHFGKKVDGLKSSHGYFGINLAGNDNIKIVSLETKNAGSIAKFKIPVKNFGPTHISNVNIDVIEVTYIDGNKKRTFDLLDKSSAPKNPTLIPGQEFMMGFSWIKTSTPKEEFLKILRDSDTLFMFAASYITANQTKWKYEFKFNFDREMSKEKELSGKWPMNILSHNLDKIG